MAAVHRLQREVDDLRYQFNSSTVELEILEGKIGGQETSIGGLDRRILEVTQQEQKPLREQIARLESAVGVAQRGLENIWEDLKSFQTHANSTAATLGQYKAKLTKLEQMVAEQSSKAKHMVESLDIVQTLVSKASSMNAVSYTVRSGDSLDKIARQYSTTVEDLRKINSLRSDLIIVGQELQIPR